MRSTHRIYQQLVLDAGLEGTPERMELAVKSMRIAENHRTFPICMLAPNNNKNKNAETRHTEEGEGEFFFVLISATEWMACSCGHDTNRPSQMM